MGPGTNREWRCRDTADVGGSDTQLHNIFTMRVSHGTSSHSYSHAYDCIIMHNHSDGTCLLLDAMSMRGSRCRQSLRHLDISDNIVEPDHGPLIAAAVAQALMGGEATTAGSGSRSGSTSGSRSGSGGNSSRSSGGSWDGSNNSTSGVSGHARNSSSSTNSSSDSTISSSDLFNSTAPGGSSSRAGLPNLEVLVLQQLNMLGCHTRRVHRHDQLPSGTTSKTGSGQQADARYAMRV